MKKQNTSRNLSSPLLFGNWLQHMLIFLFITMFLFFTTSTVFGEVQDVREAIVKVYVVSNSPDYYNPWSMQGPRGASGSGCIIENNLILTNAHVVRIKLSFRCVNTEKLSVIVRKWLLFRI